MGRKVPAAVSAAAKVVSLGLHGSGERLAKEQQRRRKLLQQIAKRKVALGRESTAASETAIALRQRIEPLSREHGRATQQVYGYFAELLEKGRRPARTRKTLERFMWALEDAGLLDDPARVAEPGGARVGSGPATSSRPYGRPAFDRDSDEPQPGAGEAEGAGPRHGPPNEAASVRALFRHLARRLHPDHARSESERLRRTEAMKAITAAYRQEDLARLLELERTLLDEMRPPENRDEALEALCRENLELLAQLRRVNAEFKALRAGSPARIFADVDALEAEIRRDVATLEELALRLRDFRNGEISLDQLLAPPRGAPLDPSSAKPKARARRRAEHARPAR